MDFVTVRRTSSPAWLNAGSGGKSVYVGFAHEPLLQEGGRAASLRRATRPSLSDQPGAAHGWLVV